MSNKNKELDVSYGTNGETTVATGATGTASASGGMNVTYGANGGTAAPTSGAGGTPATTPSINTNYSANGSTASSKMPSDILSYSEWIAEEEKRQQAQKDATYARAEEIRKEAERIAETNRQREGLDAQISYAKNIAGYGSKGEAIASMGLTGSGYGDYVESQAYATQRGEIQDANARADSAKKEALYTEKETKYNADLTYSANMSALGKEAASYHETQAEKEREETKAAVLSNISAGNYATKADLEAYLDEVGITDSNTRSQIVATWTGWNNEQSLSAIKADIEAGVYKTREDVENAAKAAGIMGNGAISILGATFDIWNNNELEEKEKETCAAFLADISAGNYATRADLETSLDQAGITDGNVRTQIIASWTTWSKADTKEKETESFNTITANIAAGKYKTREEAEEAATAAGIGNSNLISQIGAAFDIWNNTEIEKYEAESYTAFIADIEADLYTSEEALISALDAANIKNPNVRSPIIAAWHAKQNQKSEETETEQKNQFATFTDYKVGCLNGTYGIDEIDAALTRGDITQDQYREIQQEYNSRIPQNQNYFMDSAGNALSPTDAQGRIAELERFVASGWVSQATVNALKQVYASKYPSPTIPRDSVTASVGTKVNTVSISGVDGAAEVSAVTDKFIIAIAQSVGDGKVFGIAGTQRIYVYSEANGKVYELVQGDCKEKKYKRLHHFILGSGTFDNSTYEVVYK